VKPSALPITSAKMLFADTVRGRKNSWVNSTPTVGNRAAEGEDR
jgi:hypothetical protein